MSRYLSIALLLATAYPGWATTVNVPDFSFETISITAPGGYAYEPGACGPSLPCFTIPGGYGGWTFANDSGLTHAGSGLNPPGSLPDRSQAAFLAGQHASVSQNFSLVSGQYIVEFYYGSPASGKGNKSKLDVYVDGQRLSQIDVPNNTGWTQYTLSFNLASTGTHTLMIEQGTGGKHLTFIDDVSLESVSQVQAAAVASVPEPAACLLIGGGLLAIGTLLRRRRA
jgi:hypothetical protein